MSDTNVRLVVNNRLHEWKMLLTFLFNFSRVICRFRPVNQRERSEGERDDAPRLEYPDDQTVIVKIPRQPPQVYQFDKVFYDADTQQVDVYNFTARDTIEDILKGYNGTIFAYGQTGAGKSFTMFGPEGGADSIPEPAKGIIPRACKHIFDRIEADESGTEFILKCSFLEIYKESIRDLLDREKVNLKVRETPSRGVWVQDLTEHFVSCVEDIFYLLEMGEKSRSVSSTKMNSVSSRSHSLFILTLSQKNVDGSTKEGKLNLADLAGSEKVGKTGATGDTLEEAKKINQSLSALGNCINALTKAKKGHVPYRDSKLTHILRESLGGNSKTTLIIACSPHSFNVEETISTLKFGQRAKSIKNSVKINQQRSVKELEAIIENLTRELNMLRAYVAALEECILSMDSSFDLNALKEKVFAANQKSNKSDETSTPTKQSGSSEVMSPSFSNDPGILSYDPTAIAEFKFKMEQMKEKYQLEIQDLKEEIDKYRSDSGESPDDWETIKHEAARYKKELAELKSEMKAEAIRQSQQEYEFEKKILVLDSTAHKLTTNREHLENKITDLEKQKEILVGEREFLLEKNAELLSSLEATTLKYNTIESKHKDISSQHEQTKAEYEEVKQNHEANKNKISELKVELENTRSELHDVSKRLKEKEIEFTSKVKELEMLEQSFNDEDKAEKQFESELLDVQKHNSILEVESKKKDHDLQQLKILVEAKTQELDALNQNLELMKKELESKQSDVGHREKNLSERVQSLEASIREEKSKREKAEAESRHLTKKLTEQDTSFRDCKEALEKLQKESTTNNNLMTKQLNHANKRIEELMKEIELLLQTSEDHKEKTEKYRKEYKVAASWNLKENRPRSSSSSQRDRVVVPIKGGKRMSHQKRTLVDYLFSRELLPTRKDLEKSTLKGALWKQAMFRMWSQKWFILYGHKLYYFDSKSSVNADGFVLVDGCSVKIKQTNDDDRYKYHFILSHPARETIHLCALTEAQMLQWVETIDYISTMKPDDAETICTGIKENKNAESS